MEHGEGIPERVRKSGQQFISDIDAWSTAIKNGKELTDVEHTAAAKD
jgi:hypothetical protein